MAFRPQYSLPNMTQHTHTLHIKRGTWLSKLQLYNRSICKIKLLTNMKMWLSSSVYSGDKNKSQSYVQVYFEVQRYTNKLENFFVILDSLQKSIYNFQRSHEKVNWKLCHLYNRKHFGAVGQQRKFKISFLSAEQGICLAIISQYRTTLWWSDLSLR